MVILKFKAMPLRKLQQFAAADPWNGNRPARFSLEEYVMMPVGSLQAVDTSQYGHRIGIRSDTGSEHMIPESLVELWRDGKVPAERIPVLTRAISPRLMKEDFNLALPPHSVKRQFVIPLILIFLIMFVVVSWGTRSEGHFSLPLALFLSATLSIVTGGIVWAARQTGIKRRAEQIKWFLDVESGALPAPVQGRAKTLLKRFSLIYGVLLALTLVAVGGVFIWLHY